MKFEFYNQWGRGMFRQSWTDFTFILISLEHSPYKESSEVTLGLLGFVFTIYVLHRTSSDAQGKEDGE